MTPSPNASPAGGQSNVTSINSKCWVYHAMCEHGATLYVGVANDVERRLRQHRLSKDWWNEVSSVIADRYADRKQALAVEAHYIRHGNLNHMRNQQGVTPAPQPPHRWEIRRDWTINEFGTAHSNPYYALPSPASALVLRRDDPAAFDAVIAGADHRRAS